MREEFDQKTVGMSSQLAKIMTKLGPMQELLSMSQLGKSLP